jgi:putative ABC transport system permease protein
MEAASIPMKIHLVGHFFITAVIGGMIIAVLASLSPALRNSKLDIVEAIKYE